MSVCGHALALSLSVCGWRPYIDGMANHLTREARQEILERARGRPPVTVKYRDQHGQRRVCAS
jgi:hypothetical protein